jgi:hypothetical protein
MNRRLKPSPPLLFVASLRAQDKGTPASLMSLGHEFQTVRWRMRLLPLLILGIATACIQDRALAGHDNIPVDPALKRHAGQVTALGEPDAEGRLYTFRVRRLPAAPDFGADELKGWRLTMLAGKRFAHVFEVQRNSGLEITVAPLDGPLNGIAVSDVFVIENVAIERPAAEK